VLRSLLVCCLAFAACACAPVGGNSPRSTPTGQVFESIIGCEGFRTGSARTNQEVLWAVTKWARDKGIIPSGFHLCAASKNATSQVITLEIRGDAQVSGFIVGSVTFRLSDMTVVREEIVQPKNGLFL